MLSGRTNESPPVFYRTSSPSGPLPSLSFRFTTMQSRAMGIADHILPLGDLLSIWPLPRCPSDLLQHCSCPSARNYGSRGSSLVSCMHERSVGPSVCRSVLAFLAFLHFGRFLCYCSCPNAWVSLSYHCPCPPACDIGSCVYDLVFHIYVI